MPLTCSFTMLCPQCRLMLREVSVKLFLPTHSYLLHYSVLTKSHSGEPGMRWRVEARKYLPVCGSVLCLPPSRENYSYSLPKSITSFSSIEGLSSTGRCELLGILYSHSVYDVTTPGCPKHTANSKYNGFLSWHIDFEHTHTLSSGG